jgi:hypothetical protein
MTFGELLACDAETVRPMRMKVEAVWLRSRIGPAITGPGLIAVPR